MDREIKVVAFDLDLTLLTTDKQLSRRNEEALRRCAERGIHIVPTTGRFYSGVPKVVSELPYIDYVISGNGAEVREVATDRIISEEKIPWPMAIEIMKILEEFSCIYDCYVDNWGRVSQEFYDQAGEWTESVYAKNMYYNTRTPVPNLQEYLTELKHDVQKVQPFFLDMQEHARCKKAIEERMPQLIVTQSMSNNLEINIRDANKGHALHKLAEYLKIPMEQTMSFGDGLNDISMLKEAGIGVAMKNAIPEAIEAADYITDTNDNDGVAKAIEKLIF